MKNTSGEHPLKTDAWHLYWCYRCRTVVRLLRNTLYAIAARQREKH